MAYSKGQIITLNLDGTDRNYRILKLDGNIAEVVCMSSVGKSKFGGNNTYAGSDLDTYLNTTWYNTLTAAAKAAIVSKTFRQDSWYDGTSGSPTYSGHSGTTVPGTNSYSISKGSATYGAQITRNVYALSMQDVIDYITNTDVGDGKLENYNIWKMFWDTTTQPSIEEYPWLRSAEADKTNSAWSVGYYGGYFGRGGVEYAQNVRPALTIDLSKILPPQLDAPQNVTASGTVVSFDPVQNATSYAVLADGSEIGTVGAETGSTDATVTITNTSTRYIANVGTSYGSGMANPDIGTVGTNSTEIFIIPKGTIIYISANTNTGYDAFVSTSITGNITEESSGGFLAKMIINGDGTITGYANNAD